MFAITFIIASLTVVEAVHMSSLRDGRQAATLTAPPRATASSSFLPDGITADPMELRRRQETFTIQTVLQGEYTELSTLGSLCGFVASDVHWALYCDEGQYCMTDYPLLQCCSTTAETYWTSTYLYTEEITGRNTLTTTAVSTQLMSMSEAYGENCTGAPQTCYDYNATALCTDTCTSTALVCYDPYFPYCASLYSSGFSPSDQGTTTTYIPTQWGVSYFCDTEAYGLGYGEYGYWPSVTSSYVTTSGADTSTAPTFTPHVVPYSRTQASRPASQAMLLGPTSSTTSSATSCRILTPAARVIGAVSLLALCYVLLLP